MTETNQDNAPLKRSISLPFLIFYGLGTMIGGGIYALTGKVAGVAGMYAPVAFALSAFLALITAFSYAELSARFPFSAGEVRYIDAAFLRKKFSALIGWLIVFTGIVSSAALAHATAGFIHDFILIPVLPLTIAIVLALGCVALWGITESVILVTVITLMEIGGLLLVIYAGHHDLATLTTRWPEIIPPFSLNDTIIWSGIFGGAFLAFYAFIGFEDMVNVAEEVKDAPRTMPLAITISIFVTLVIYVLISLIAVLMIAPDELAQSNTPLATIIDKSGTNIPAALMGIISILATVNGVLVQMIMGSRVLYGMARNGETASWFAPVHPKTQTPLRATIFVIALVVLLALLSDLTTLAKIASTIILFVFACVNAALLKLKGTKMAHKEKLFTVPFFTPLTGLILCSIMLAGQLVYLYEAFIKG